jgi:succinate-semialdehyde dehydrogenase/glutarate-semialdehyde dehydrogenase
MKEAQSDISNLENDWISSINPASLEICGKVKVSSHSEIYDAVQKAKDGFSYWAKLDLAKRVKIIKQAQQLLLNRAESIACLITEEMGRPLVESLSLELVGAIDLMDYYIRNAKSFLRDRSLPIHNPLFIRRKSLIINEPLGVMGIITPWNWPLLIPMGCIVPALLAGNTVVFKPSENTPLIGIEIKKLFRDAGVPEGIFQVVQGYASCGRSLLDSGIEKIFFTGNTEVGEKVMSRAAQSLKSTVLELGGNDPAIVCEDADIENCTSGILWGGFNNCGQNCNSIERVYVERSILDRFIGILIKKVKKLRVGDGKNEDIDLGPVATEMQLMKMASVVESALDKGGEILCGGHIMDTHTGYFFEPTVMRWKNSLNRVPDEEVFGPLIHVIPVSDIQQAVQLSNESSFGLAASVWTRNVKKGQSIARDIESGTVMINDSVVSFGIAEASWTGVKKSGIGWTHGQKGMDEMINIKYVCVDNQFRLQKFWWFPYSQRMNVAIKKAMSLLYSGKILKRLAAIPLTLKNFAGYLLKNRHRDDKW